MPWTVGIEYEKDRAKIQNTNEYKKQYDAAKTANILNQLGLQDIFPLRRSLLQNTNNAEYEWPDETTPLLQPMKTPRGAGPQKYGTFTK